jgi:HEPN domain-containing protein
MKKATREWVAKAEADWRGAARLARGSERLHDLVCFHCQQSAEKYLKALLEELGQTIPKTHDLERLVDLLLPQHADLRRHQRILRPLTEFAITARYPGTNASKRQAEAARRWASQVRKTCRALLSIGPRRRKSP